MQFSKEYLEDLADEMSVGEMADHLKMAKSTLYYHLRKLGVKRRSRSEAQKLHIEKSGHQRTGSKHSDDVKNQISSSSREYWDSEDGRKQKAKLAKLRRTEWEQTTAKSRRAKMSQLRDAPRPKAGDLSKFGVLLAEFLTEQGLQVTCSSSLTPGHVSDIILKKERVVIELVPPVSVYGSEAEEKLNERYNRLAGDLNAVQYRVLIVEQVSNSLSTARCQRVYDEIKTFKGKNKTIQS
jgi:hypothetical protein